MCATFAVIKCVCMAFWVVDECSARCSCLEDKTPMTNALAERSPTVTLASESSTPSSAIPAALLPALDTSSLAPLRHFVQQFARVLETAENEAWILQQGKVLLSALVAHDGWLPSELAQPHPQHYQQFLLHADSAGRFSVVSFVWGPGQRTPIHDHTVWGLIGVLRGAEYSQSYARHALDGWVAQGQPVLLTPGQVEAVSPTIGDVHQVSNALDGGTSISIHVYGANIGAVSRHVFKEDGAVVPFVSGYSNSWVPNIWDESLH